MHHRTITAPHRTAPPHPDRSVNNTFNIQGVLDNTMPFKTVEDAARLRLRISECFERAALPQTTPEVRQGGGWGGTGGRERWGQPRLCCVSFCGGRESGAGLTFKNVRLCLPPLLQERKQLLSIVIVGGGPTGVEVGEATVLAVPVQSCAVREAPAPYSIALVDNTLYRSAPVPHRPAPAEQP